MRILKKICGCFLIIIAALLSVAVVATVPNGFMISINRIKESTSSGIAYLVGTLVGSIIFILIIILIGKLGLKLIRTKSKSENSIDEIES